MSELNVNTVTATDVTVNGTITASNGYKLPSYTDVNRPVSSSDGVIIYNTTSSDIELWNGSSWAGLGTAGLRTWTTATRPAAPVTGAIGFNTETSELEYYSGTDWTTISAAEAASGGGGTPPPSTPTIPWAYSETGSSSSEGNQNISYFPDNFMFSYTRRAGSINNFGYYEGYGRHMAIGLGDMTGKQMRVLVQAAGSGGHRDDGDGATPGDDGNMIYISFSQSACEEYFSGVIPRYLHISLGSGGTGIGGASNPMINPVTPYGNGYPGANASTANTQGSYGGHASTDCLVWMSSSTDAFSTSDALHIATITGGRGAGGYDGGSGGTPVNTPGTGLNGITFFDYRSRQNGGQVESRSPSSPRQVSSHWMVDTDSRRSQMDFYSYGAGNFGLGGSFVGQNGNSINGGPALASVDII